MAVLGSYGECHNADHAIFLPTPSKPVSDNLTLRIAYIKTDSRLTNYFHFDQLMDIVLVGWQQQLH